ncbi:hypothetical protein GOP47_0029434 [Adiantum capillus-veneris]|nr:hypothetical protein GOP47_0029434 [Adiantum capillus-veneris]
MAMAASTRHSTFTSLNPCSVDSPDDLLFKLMYISMELQKVRAEGQLQETELWRLQELLSIMTKERDEAREECQRLQECIFLQQTPSMGVDSASSFMHSSSMVSSPSSMSPWSLQELEEHLNSDDFCPPVGAPTPFELQQALESLVQSCDKGQPFSHMKPGNGSAMQISHPEIPREALDQVLGFDTPPCLNLSEPQQLTDERVSTVLPSVRSLSRQSSSNSNSVSVQSVQRGQVSLESLDGMTALSPGAAELAPAITMASMISNVPCPSSSIPCPSSSMGGNGLHATQQILPLTPLVGGSGPTIAYDATESDIDVSSVIPNHALSSSSFECKNGASAAIEPLQMQHLGNNRLPTKVSASCAMPVNGETVAIPINTSASTMPSMGRNIPSLTSNNSIATGCSGKNLAYPQSSMAPFSATASTMASHSFAVTPPLAKVLSTETFPTSQSIAVSSTYCHQQAAPTQMRQFHLPEPPEADPQVMLSSLPEKGKLLQAVMQAGPLLQTLLLAGPLPQWRYPPPALSTRDIPRVSLAPGHALPTAAGMQGTGGGGSGSRSPATIMRKRIAIAEPSFQNKKLRKLSPSPVKKNLGICVGSGGSDRQDLAVGSFSQHREPHIC